MLLINKSYLVDIFLFLKAKSNEFWIRKSVIYRGCIVCISFWLYVNMWDKNQIVTRNWCKTLNVHMYLEIITKTYRWIFTMFLQGKSNRWGPITIFQFFFHKTYILQQSQTSKMKIGFCKNVFKLTSWTDIGMHILYSFKSIAV